MAHHSDKPFTDETQAKDDGIPSKTLDEARRDLEQVKSDLGATGRFPDGKLVGHDEGEIQFRVGTRDNNVVIEFGQSVHWVGMTRSQAQELGQLLIIRADQIRD